MRCAMDAQDEQEVFRGEDSDLGPAQGTLLQPGFQLLEADGKRGLPIHERPVKLNCGAAVAHIDIAVTVPH